MGFTGKRTPCHQSPFHVTINDPGEQMVTPRRYVGASSSKNNLICLGRFCSKSERLSVRQGIVKGMKGRELDEESQNHSNNSSLRNDKKSGTYVKCTSSTRSHNRKNLFSLGDGLILIFFFILYWACMVHGGFPGRGPPPPLRGPPLLPHHPLAPGGHRSHAHSRNSPFSRRRPPPPHAHHPHHAHRHGPQQKLGKTPTSDLAVAAQTLYDLRGYHIPISGPETPRFHRQNDPFTLPTPLASNLRERGVHHLPQDTRTAPLVFPSFYQEQPTPTPTRPSIFGHNQHISQTRFEPPGSFHLGGNSASTKITLEQQSSSSRDQFRPSQIDISLHNNQVLSTPATGPQYGPQSQAPTLLTPEKKSLSSTTRTRAPVKLSKNQQQDPFVYVYDEVDYDEGEDSDFTLGGGSRDRTPQGQTNSNRITPSTSTTTVAPLRAREPTIIPTPSGFPTVQQQEPQYVHQNHQALYSTSTSTARPTTTQNNIYYNPQKDDYQAPFTDRGIIRPPVTPRPNVEIVPSSERKPPPDQSNAIVPALARLRNEGRDYSRGGITPSPPQAHHLLNDNFRRPGVQLTTTTFAPPTPQVSQYQRESIFNNQPQGRQVSPSPPPAPVPYFPAGLDRRPFETQNEIPFNQQAPVRNGNTQQHFDQVVNLLQEEEEQYRGQNNNPGENLLDPGFNNPGKLRPVNTIIPKNRIPKEDILPPNFSLTHGIDYTTPLTTLVSPEAPQRVRGDPTQQRVREKSQVTRIREEFPTRTRDEIPRTPQKVIPNQSHVPNRPSTVIFPENDYEDENQNIINNQHHSQIVNEPQPAPTPTRTRGRQPPQRTTTTSTTTSPSVLEHQRTRTLSPRQRLRPSYNRQSIPTLATTTTSTTTPSPTFVEYPSQEYLDDYDNNHAPQYQQTTSPPQQAGLQQKSKPSFPPFPGKSKELQQEVVTTSQAPQLQRQRPQVSSQERPGKLTGRVTKTNRFRESTTLDTTTSPRTTGKPLYTTGKMLSREGGLYAGQRITSSHVYGQPVPNIPINSVLDKMPGVLDGKSVVLATTRPSFGSPQKHLRSKQRPTPEHGPKRVRPTARPRLENSLDIVETVTLKPIEEQPKRLRAGNQFVRGQNPKTDNDASTEVLSRRRKVRPRQRRPHQQLPTSTDSNVQPYTETVSIHPLRGVSRESDAEKETHYLQKEREDITGDTVVETTTTAVVPTSPRSRRPRPGGKQLGSSQQQENVSERSRESSVGSEDNEEDKPQKPVRKLRPRLRPVPQLTPQQQRGHSPEIITQSQSAQVDRKPSDAPGKFSSRYRDDETETSTSTSTGLNKFSPSAARPTFKPPSAQKKSLTRKQRPKEPNGDRGGQTGGSDELPDSIKLSPKDVIANRKPARRIPPGSASDRLKALQQRRNKVFNNNDQSDGEETAEGRQVPVSKRPRLKPNPATPAALQSENEDAEQQLPNPQRLRRPPALQQRHQSQEANGAKRAVGNGNRLQNRVRPPVIDEDYEDTDNTDDLEDDNSEYSNDDHEESSPPTTYSSTSTSVSTSSVTPQTERSYVTVTSRPVAKSNGGGFYRNKSLEVTSDEARSVLGIPRPAAPSRNQGAKRLRLQKQFPIEHEQEQTEEEEDEDDDIEEEEAERQQFRQRPRFRQAIQKQNNERELGNGRNFRPVQRESQQQEPRPIGAQNGRRLHQQSHKARHHQPQHQRQEEEEVEEQHQDESEYRDEDDHDDKEVPPRKPYLHNKQIKPQTSTFSPSSQILRKKLNTLYQNNGSLDENDGAVETTTVTSSSSTSTSTLSTSQLLPDQNTRSEKLPLALPVRSGPQPIKQGLLKARLRPNRRFNTGTGNGPQARISISASTTQATITTSENIEVGRGEEKLKHATTRVSKSSRPRLHRGERKRKEKKFVDMSTENPGLPLESIFPEMSS